MITGFPLPLARRFARWFLVLIILGCPPALAGDPVPGLDAAAVAAFPAPIFERIVERITTQTTFQQFGPKGIVRWAPRTIELIEFVGVPSPSFPRTYLYAMRYVVSVLGAEQSLIVEGTVCQVMVLLREGTYSEPTVVCDPVNLNHATAAL